MEYSVLIVDDQIESIKYVSRLLNDMGLGDNIYSAPNGKVALQLIEKVLPDIVLSDWGMPEMDGLELLRVLKSSPRTKDIPFIMISAVKVDAQSMKDSFDVGVHDYLRKPFDRLEFVARVSATLKLHEAYLKIKKSNVEIANQSLLISKQREELEKLNTTKDKIFSVISHDLRSPLATLDGLLQIFGDEQIELSKEELKECTTTVQLELNKIQILMDNLLYWAKSQIADRKAVKSQLSPSDITNEIVELFSDKIQKKYIEIDNQIATDMIIWADKNTLSFLIRNLLANAVKFTPEQGTITIYADEIEHMVRIAIADTGIGMDQETMDKLFKDRIMTTKVGTSGESGTGLGLLLCKDMVEQAKGSIHVKSKIKEGSEFSFLLPNTEIDQ